MLPGLYDKTKRTMLNMSIYPPTEKQVASSGGRACQAVRVLGAAEPLLTVPVECSAVSAHSKKSASSSGFEHVFLNRLRMGWT